MVAVGWLLILSGAVVSIWGWVRMLFATFRMGVLWAVGFILVPCFSIYLVIAHTDRFLKPFLANLGGGILYQVGIRMAFGNIRPPELEHRFAAGRAAPMPPPGSGMDPVLPGSYVPPPSDEPLSMFEQVLASTDPMVLAGVGGMLVFTVVGILVGGVLLFTMRDQPEDSEDPAG